MEKTYVYERQFYLVNVLVTGIFCAALVVYALVALAFGSNFFPPVILALLAVVSAYQVWNTFVAIANPQKVTVSPEAIAFTAFGRTDSFAVQDIKEFTVREFAARERIYVRINGGGLIRGRYWVQTGKMSDGEDLYQHVYDLEERICPDSLRVRARKSSLEHARLAQKQQAAQAKKHNEKNTKGGAATAA